MNYKKTKLKNSLRVITVPMKDNPTVTVLVLVETGSKYETKEKNGISHFLEHMCFKGTTKRPSAQIIASELDALGSQYNAFTAQEYTGYYAKSGAKHFKKILDVVSDIYLHSTFPEAEMEKEKGVIIEEINMYEDMPARHVQDLFMELLYGDQPAGWNIAGPRENIKKMKRDDFIEYHKKHYVPRATTVIVAGQVTEKQALQSVKKIFEQVLNAKKDDKLRVIEKQTDPQVLLKHKATDQTHLVLGVRTFDTYHKDNPVLDVLSVILGGGMSSRLFLKLREEMGVAYYVKASADSFTDHGFLEIRAGVDTKRSVEVVQAIIAECKRLSKGIVSKEELSKVKEYISGNMKLELESSDAFASFYGGQEILHKRILRLEDEEKKIRKVTAAQVRQLAQKIFIDQTLNLAVIGPYTDKKMFSEVLTFK